jgi:hypothetical protein
VTENELKSEWIGWRLVMDWERGEDSGWGWTTTGERARGGRGSTCSWQRGTAGVTIARLAGTSGQNVGEGVWYKLRSWAM